MNWFERYAIPGIYFVSLLVAFYLIIFGFPCEKQTIVTAFAAAISLSVPVGYILTIISQRIYYWLPRSCQLHSNAWYHEAKNQPKSKRMSEEIVEAKVAVLGRWKIKSDKSDKGRWLQEWFTKRMDVLAINCSLILATIIGWFLAFLGLCFLKPLPATVKWYRLLLPVGITTLVIIFWLILSIQLLSKQIKYALVMFYADLREINGKATSPNSG